MMTVRFASFGYQINHLALFSCTYQAKVNRIFPQYDLCANVGNIRILLQLLMKINWNSWELNHIWCKLTSPPPSANKDALSGFETQRGRHQKSETGISVAPKKWTCVQQKIFFNLKNWHLPCYIGIILKWLFFLVSNQSINANTANIVYYWKTRMQGSVNRTDQCNSDYCVCYLSVKLSCV